MVDLKIMIETFQSRRRMAIFKVFDNVLTPTEMRNKIKLFYPSMSRNNCTDELKWLAKRDIVKCINPEARKGRKYVLLELGEQMRKEFLKSSLAEEFEYVNY